MIDKKELYRHVVASLQYGSVFHKKTMVLWTSLLFISTLYPLGTIIYLIFIKIGLVVYNYDDMLFAIYCNIAMLIFAGIVLCVLAPRIWLKKKIFLWLDDVVLRHAKVKEVDSMSSRGMKFTKIAVMFSYKKEKYRMISGEPVSKLAWLGCNGYDRNFTKYVNREADILYSPKYNQVLLLKD